MRPHQPPDQVETFLAMESDTGFVSTYMRHGDLVREFFADEVDIEDSHRLAQLFERNALDDSEEGLVTRPASDWLATLVPGRPGQ